MTKDEETGAFHRRLTQKNIFFAKYESHDLSIFVYRGEESQVVGRFKMQGLLGVRRVGIMTEGKVGLDQSLSKANLKRREEQNSVNMGTSKGMFIKMHILKYRRGG